MPNLKYFGFYLHNYKLNTASLKFITNYIDQPTFLATE